MSCTHPFRRSRGQELCTVCGSARTNEYWACPACIGSKPDVTPRPWDGRHDGDRRQHLTLDEIRGARQTTP